MGNEQVTKRLANQSAILKALHFDGAMQRSALNERCKIRKSSITSIVQQLLDVGIVRQQQSGRVRSPLVLDDERFHVFAMAITPRDVTLARVYLDGRVAGPLVRAIDPSDGPDSVLAVAGEGIEALLASHSERPMGIGVSVPGVVDPDQGMCIEAVNLHEWHQVPVARALWARENLPVHIDNDVRCQLRSAVWFDRLQRDVENVIYVHLHDGVACAIMSRGQLVHGERFSAGEVGHVRAGREGRPCSCGREDCLETYCSLPAILAALQKAVPDHVFGNAASVLSLADDEAVAAVLRDAMRRLARALAGLVAAVDPAALVFGTATPLLSELLKPMLATSISDELSGVQAGAADILSGEATGRAALRGAAAHAISHAFDSGSFAVPAMDH